MKKMSIACITGALFVLCGATLPQPASLSSTNADYDGSSLFLKGNVVLTHHLGKMIAEEATLEKQETGSEFPFSVIHLKNSVMLTLKDRGELHCQSADLDFTSLKGLLLSSGEERVIYAHPGKNNNATALFRILGKKVELSLFNKESSDKKSEVDIDSIVATEGVTLEYADHFSLVGDHALFEKRLLSNEEMLKKDFVSVLTAFPKDDASHCVLSHEQDRIDAKKVELDTLHSKVRFLTPRGTLASALTGSALTFSSDLLLWDHAKNMVTLTGHIIAEDPALGRLQAEEELQLSHTDNKGKRLLQTIRSKGKTTLSYQTAQNLSPHVLVSHGVITIDRKKLCATIESPKHKGVILPENQIHYQDDSLSLYADRAHIDYSLVEGTWRPASLSLKGEVRILSHEVNQQARCGVADRIHFSPETRTLILAANPGKKVLFWNHEEALKLSAQEIHITQDPSTKKEIVKGIGLVQFTFSSEEQDLFKKIFPFYQE